MSNKLLNANHSTHDVYGDGWVVNLRQSVLDWYSSEMQKAQYKDADDTAMLDAVAAKIAEEKVYAPMEWLNSAVEEIAEGLLELDEWTMSHYEIEEYLLDKV